MNFDGSIKMNMAGGGGIIGSHDGKVCGPFDIPLHTNCVISAELLAMFHGLKLCTRLGIFNVWREVDAILVISMINSGYSNPKNFYLIRNIKKLLSQLNFCISHVYREANVVADFLANMGCQLINDIEFSPVNLPYMLKAVYSGLSVLFPLVGGFCGSLIIFCCRSVIEFLRACSIPFAVTFVASVFAGHSRMYLGFFVVSGLVGELWHLSSSER
ncbi:hypothetical protein M5K25_018888 [Dendrobium thyrsiflorum]|uniref:RNase H type-1 domain-containing protein n=1 Tax=Dendrobium thyrsiflorum TaxID=117978 RepID=A0ABD0UD95_DENTH